MNSVNIVGTLASAPRLDPESMTPCCTARLCVAEPGKDGQIWRTWIPIEAWAQAALSLAPVPEGTTIALVGKLKWKSWLKEGKKEGGLIVSTVMLEVFPTAAEEAKEGPDGPPSTQ